MPQDGHGLSIRPPTLATIDVLNAGAQGMAKTNGHWARQTSGGGVVLTGWPGEISSSE